MRYQDCAKNAKTRLMGDSMTFYIAQRNKKTGAFQIWDKDGEPNEFRDKAKAINAYEMAIQFEGMKNVLLLEEVNTTVKVTVTTPPEEQKNKSR